jgi:hypothetical protein
VSDNERFGTPPSGSSCVVLERGEWERLRAENTRYKAALEEIRNELGVPQPGYPAPVANAAHIARAALAPRTGGEEK